MRIVIGSEDLAGEVQVFSEWREGNVQVHGLRVFLDGENMATALWPDEERPALLIWLNPDHSDAAQTVSGLLAKAAELVAALTTL